MFKYYRKLRSRPISTLTRKTLVATLRDALRSDIKSGRYQVGERLPSEAKLTEEHSVSRTVVREAIAALRGDGLVEPRQGSGVYVIEPPASIPAPFTKFDTFRLSSVIELLELRTAVEVEAAAKRHNMPRATVRSPGRDWKDLDDRGFRLVAGVNDISMLIESAQNSLTEATGQVSSEVKTY